MNQLDRRPSLRRNYYRRVRNCFVAAGVIHALAFAFAPPYHPAPPIMRPDPIRLLPVHLGWGEGLAAAPAMAAVAPGGSPVRAHASPLAGVLQTGEGEVRSEQWAAPAAPAATGSARAGSGGGGPGTGVASEDESPPVYYGYDTAPRTLKTVEPPYPPMAREAGLEGTVVINVNLDEHGRILRAWVASASASELLITAALDAVYQFEFAPGLDRGIPVRTTVAIPFRFHLNKIS
jgi:TonB family protein